MSGPSILVLVVLLAAAGAWLGWVLSGRRQAERETLLQHQLNRVYVEREIEHKRHEAALHSLTRAALGAIRPQRDE